MKFKRRDTEVFSLSFLDCICCGFGAVLLLFVLTTGKKADTKFELMAKIEEIVGLMENDIAKKDKELKELKRSLFLTRQRNTEIDSEISKKKKAHTELDEELKLLLQQLMTMEKAKEKLLLEKDNMPTQEEEPPIPIPNEEKRQYLTGFKMDGRHVLFLVEASGGMMEDSEEDAIKRLGDTDEEKRKAPKWVRVKKGLQWMIANLRSDSKYKIIFFNKEVIPIQTEFGLDWFDPMDRELTLKVLDEIEEIVPEGGANLERAFDIVDDLSIVPDRIVLVADGLPTLADSYSVSSVVDDHDRMNMFRVAKKALMVECPVNVLLYPKLNDPGAAVHFWRLTNERSGAMVCPSKDWPNI